MHRGGECDIDRKPQAIRNWGACFIAVYKKFVCFLQGTDIPKWKYFPFRNCRSRIEKIRLSGSSGYRSLYLFLALLYPLVRIHIVFSVGWCCGLAGGSDIDVEVY